MESISEKITSYLGSRGYPQVEVYPDVKPNREARIVDVVIVVDQPIKSL